MQLLSICLNRFHIFEIFLSFYPFRTRSDFSILNSIQNLKSSSKRVESFETFVVSQYSEYIRARPLRGWIDTDPLEPRAALGLAALHSGYSEALLGVADESFLMKHLLEQLETHGFPCTYPPVQGSTVNAEGVLYTSRAALALWDALAKILGALRVRDDPVPLFSRWERAMPTLPAPRPGTVWDEGFGSDPPWNPTDFQRREGYSRKTPD